MKLQAKISLLVVPLIVAPLMALTYLAQLQLRETFTNRMIQEMTAVLEHVEQSVADLGRTAEANVSLFANAYLLQKYLMIPDEWERYRLIQPKISFGAATSRRSMPG